MLKLHLHDSRCLRIYLGCSHDDSYVRILRSYELDTHAQANITLVEGPPFGDGLNALNLRRVRFPGLFRLGMLDRADSDGIPTAYPTPIGPRSLRRNVPESPYQSVTNPSTTTTPASSVAVPLQPVRPPSTATTLSFDHQIGKEDKGSTSWAKLAETAHNIAQVEAVKAAEAAAQKKKEAAEHAAEFKKRLVPLSKAQELLDQGIVPRNIKGQRIDPPERDYDKDQVQRVRKVKWCIVHFLSPRGCPYRSNCAHKHEPTPSADDMEWLRLVARLQPCKNTSACDDLHCCYGHRCIAPVKDKLKKGKNCVMGEDCKFDDFYHGIDTNIVKTVTI